MYKAGCYLTTEGYRSCSITRYFTLYGEEYAEIQKSNGEKTQLKRWKVIEDRD